MKHIFTQFILLALTLGIMAPATYASNDDIVTLKVDELDQVYQLTVPVSQLFMTIPKDNFKPTKNFGVSADNPRYFYFLDPQQGVIASGWFEAAASYAGFEKHWNAEKDGWKKSRMPAPVNETLFNADGWQGVSYDITLPDEMGNNTHIRAYYAYANTWIDLHLSMTSKADIHSMRATLMSLLKRIEVHQRPD